MLTSKQRAYLRSLANGAPVICQIGKEGISDNLIKQLDDALSARELVKTRVLENAPMFAKEALYETAEKLGAEPVLQSAKPLFYTDRQKMQKNEL